jgi:hypothetical protein
MKTGKTERYQNRQKALRQEKLQERFKFEATRMNGYELIYPSTNPEQNKLYDLLIDKS